MLGSQQVILRIRRGLWLWWNPTAFSVVLWGGLFRGLSSVASSWSAWKCCRYKTTFSAAPESSLTGSVMKVSEDLLSHHYCQLRTKPFYPDLVEYMTSGPVVVMVSAPFFLFILMTYLLVMLTQACSEKCLNPKFSVLLENIFLTLLISFR